MDVTAYLGRIAYRGALTPNADTLRALQLAHLQTIPFENLDIHLRRPILLDLDRLFQKMVVQRRGGLCYELNGLFAALLRALGFPVTYLSARDAHPDGSYGPEFDHLTLLVQTYEDGDAHAVTDWLVDVGWGDTFCVPLRLDRCDLQAEGARAYRLEQSGIHYILWQRQYSGDWEEKSLPNLSNESLPDGGEHAGRSASQAPTEASAHGANSDDRWSRSWQDHALAGVAGAWLHHRWR